MHSALSTWQTSSIRNMFNETLNEQAGIRGGPTWHLLGVAEGLALYHLTQKPLVKCDSNFSFNELKKIELKSGICSHGRHVSSAPHHTAAGNVIVQTGHSEHCGKSRGAMLT